MHRHLLWIVVGVVGIGNGFGQNCTVTTTVRFVDDHAQPISDVTADQLKAEIESSPAKVVAISPATRPKIILLIDASSSIKGTWSEAVTAAKRFAATVNNDIAVAVFRDRILGGSNNQNNTEKFLNELSGLQPSRGGTALYDTLVEVASGVKDREVALVMIGDGEDNMSHYSSD